MVGSSSQVLAAIKKSKKAVKASKMEFAIHDIYQKAQDSAECVRGPTGIIFDHRMIEHKCLWDPNYQECPDRFTTVIDRCQELGLLDRCHKIEPKEATKEQVLRLHSVEHLNILKATDGWKGDTDLLESIASKYDAIYIHPMTYRLSLLSVGCTIELVENVVKGNVQNGMAIIRPPGHHAMKSEFCGYCYFNNVALAADHALNKMGVPRILIVDWDVHHGQATQQMFYSDPRVVYFSIHRYEYGTFWPNLRESEFDHVGDEEKKAAGFNFNIPLNKTKMTNADYLAIFHQVLLPMATEFQPELIIISSGYDAAVGCPEGEMEVTPACYAHLLHSLMGLANGKVVVVLEGGYYLKSLAEGAALTLRSLLGDPCPTLIESPTAVSDSIASTILNVTYCHRKYWNCFKFHDTFSVEDLDSKDNVSNSEAGYHMPEVNFNFDDIIPTVFPTRDCHPTRPKEVLLHFDQMMNHLISETKLINPKYKVSFVYDPSMMAHQNKFENHPEKPERISAIYEALEELKLLNRLNMLESRFASAEELILVHPKEMVEKMESLGNLENEYENCCNIKIWNDASKQSSYESIYFHPKSFVCASLAVGSLLQVVDSVMTGVSGSGVAVIRPPGHHAEQTEPYGFCIFNNVSIAAKYAIKNYNTKRILILDWDVHHGNGTQHIFEDDNKVLYISLHRYDNGSFFPKSTDGDASVVGREEGRGYNVNIPWNKSGMGPAEYVAAFHRIVLPIAYEYNPELVIISAGFDAAVGDPLGGCKLTPETYAHLTHWLMSLAGGRVIVALEGGYNVRSISYSMAMCTKALLGDPLPSLERDLMPCASAIDTIKKVIQIQSEFWQIRKFNKALPVEDVLNTKPLLESINEETKICKISEIFEQLSLAEGSTKLGIECLANDKKDQNNSNVFQGSGGECSSSDPSSQSGEPKKQTLVDYLSENIQMLTSEQMYAVVPLPGCPHLPQVSPTPSQGIDVSTPCAECSSTQENWICLTCYSVHCGRFINEHMVGHGEEAAHPLCLSFADLSVWCYSCEAYIENPVLFAAKNAAHISKFGTEMVWSYSTPKQ